MPFRSRHVLIATGFHLLLFAFLILGVQCTRLPEPPPVIEALVITGHNKAGELVTEPPPAEKVEEPTPEPPKPEPPPPPPEPPKPEPPKPEPPKPDPEIEKKKIEQEKIKREQEIKLQADIQRKKEEDEKKKQEELEVKRKKEEEEKKKKEEERKRIEDEKRKLEEERKQKEEEQRRLKQMMEESLSNEAKDRAEAARIGEVQKTWGQMLGEHIAQRWLRPPGLPSGLRCVAQIDILPNGEVISVKIIRGSGNAAFDASVENAIYKSSPLPLPSDPKAFQRQLQPEFTPESLDQMSR
ncbi:protein TolA [Panacagrimonas perspica]|uniref:cell envelope integrity protein TolA n=1 Tax=Panacagrimonas perspica TaxID=381431 RepID=UPI0010600196|nr:cell envelope integrity protein TolA [Panacagrimonas perspica]THD04495.1 protein TolA [Panacagrimonas perspica]